MVAIDLTGRKALVTGGSHGIGAGIVRVLTDCRASVGKRDTGSACGQAAAERLLAELAPGDSRQVIAFPVWAASSADSPSWWMGGEQSGSSGSR